MSHDHHRLLVGLVVAAQAMLCNPSNASAQPLVPSPFATPPGVPSPLPPPPPGPGVVPPPAGDYVPPVLGEPAPPPILLAAPSWVDEEFQAVQSMATRNTKVLVDNPHRPLFDVMLEPVLGYSGSQRFYVGGRGTLEILLDQYASLWVDGTIATAHGATTTDNDVGPYIAVEGGLGIPVKSTTVSNGLMVHWPGHLSEEGPNSALVADYEKTCARWMAESQYQARGGGDVGFLARSSQIIGLLNSSCYSTKIPFGKETKAWVLRGGYSFVKKPGTLRASASVTAADGTEFTPKADAQCGANCVTGDGITTSQRLQTVFVGIEHVSRQDTHLVLGNGRRDQHHAVQLFADVLYAPVIKFDNFVYQGQGFDIQGSRSKTMPFGIRCGMRGRWNIGTFGIELGARPSLFAPEGYVQLSAGAHLGFL